MFLGSPGACGVVGKHWHLAVHAEVGGKRQTGDMHPAFSASLQLYSAPPFPTYHLVTDLCGRAPFVWPCSPANYPPEVLMILSCLFSELKAPQQHGVLLPCPMQLVHWCV